ncbi:hypothetical protein BDY19DRAFT_766248 [Irpex rosettiformis]|uniref:Uncharacterized protein n=1 Tax=Irpex rosettiformis TaxID=378272 RepID=A0ACB8U8N4_9APHY|nr:hypothetical protein BDY19DRAFT_766248 [Irpex rosettiformis]
MFDVLNMSGFERWPRSQLHRRLLSHGIYLPVSVSLAEAQTMFVRHIVEGHCFHSDHVSSPACRTVSDGITPTVDDINVDGQLTVLSTFAARLPLKPLRRVFDLLHISYDSTASLSGLRAVLRRHIKHLQRGKNSPTQCSPMQMTYADKIASARSATREHRERISTSWPQLIPQSLKDVLVENFRKETSSNTLGTFTCGCCAEDALASCEVKLDISSLPLPLLAYSDDRLRRMGAGYLQPDFMLVQSSVIAHTNQVAFLLNWHA